jgi:hypothetical protein
MSSEKIKNPIDYLTIGHVTKDLHHDSFSLGGTASYSSLTALALGLRVGILTSCESDYPIDLLNKTQIINVGSEKTTTFENIYLF